MPPPPRTVAPDASLGREAAFAQVALPASTPAAPLAERAAAAPAARQPRALVAMGRACHALGAAALLLPFAADGAAIEPTVVDDRDAIELVALRKVDFAITGVALSPRDLQAGLQGTLLGVELFALVAADSSPLHGLRGDTVRAVLTGTVHSWGDVGLAGGRVILGVPAHQSLQQRAARALVLGDPFASTAVPVDGDAGALELLRREPTAVAVVHAAALAPLAGVRALAIEGGTPTIDAFERGTYTAGTPVLLVTFGPPRGAAAEVAAFLRRGDSTLPEASVCVRR